MFGSKQLLRSIVLASSACLPPFGMAAVAQEAPAEAELFATCGGFLEGAAFDGAGRLWVVDLLHGGIYSVDSAGNCVQRANTGGAPNGARFSPDGRLFIADNELGIVALDITTLEMEVIVDSYQGERITSANDLAFDARGGVYFTDPRGATYLNPIGRVFYLPPGASGGGAGDALQLVADNMAFPNGIAVSADGQNVLVGEMFEKTIVGLPAVGSNSIFQGAYVHLRTLSGLGPDGMAIAEDDSLFWAQFQGSSVGRADRYGRIIQELNLPEQAGALVTNVALHDGYLYVTEASNGEIWRFALGYSE